MARNFQGYDSYFILKYLRQNGVQYDVIMRGAKAHSLSVDMFKSNSSIPWTLFRCDWLIFPKRLDWPNLPKAILIILKRRISTTWVPFLIHPTNDPDGMKPDDRKKFFEWYNPLKQNNHVFDFAQEILAYCRSDVDILRRCWLEFRELLSTITDLDPFEKCLTIASACNMVFRTHYL